MWRIHDETALKAIQERMGGKDTANTEKGAKMNPMQIKTLETATPMYRKVTERALEGKCSPRSAIKAFCLHCVGYERAVVTNCTSFGCPLYAFRPYQKGDEDAENPSESG